MWPATQSVSSAASRRGFTIVELLIVIVVIGILATITIIAYNGISGKAKVAAIQSDVTNAAKALAIFKVGTSTTEQYPTANDCSASPAANTICLKTSSGNSVVYQVNNGTSPASFCIMVTNGTISYEATSDSNAPVLGSCPGVLATGVSCPSNFIVVPGSSTYGTSDFCVMKYEAKQASATVPISQASGVPWDNIAQTNAITYSANVAGCTGCHLTSEAEWLTLAQNVLGVPSNWSGGIVGTGYIYSGHNDNVPAGTLAADTSDSNGYSGTGNSGTSNQRRTLTLTNGEVIWDFAGNVREWTTGSTTNNQPGAAGYAWREWNAIAGTGSVSPNPFPVYGTPAASTWTSAQGIGRVISSTTETASRVFTRGGSYNDGIEAGVYSLVPNTTAAVGGVGFRVAK